MIGLKAPLRTFTLQQLANMNQFEYGAAPLSVGTALAIASGQCAGILTPAVIDRVHASRCIVENIAGGKEAVYGINTGFGPLCNTRIAPRDTVTLQYNILKSHSVGVGGPVPLHIARLMLVLKVQSLAQGFSGVHAETLQRVIWHIENDIIPYVPKQGSVGASGDLAPLAHLFLPLIGLGQVWYKGKWTDTGYMMQQEGIAPIKLGSKEGLALINGTQFMAAFGVEVAARLQSVLSHADLIAAMMLDGLLGSSAPFREEVHALRPYAGSKHVAMRMSKLLQDSEMVKSHEHCNRVQDPYSLRCIPQVHGASRNAWLHLKEMVTIEINAVTDNPLILPDGESISAGNFHGQPMALPLDYACLAASEVGNISDRRIYLSLTGIANNVPRLLMKDTGLNSAFMMPQYTTAALASENKTFCFPASADSIPTSLGQEDHVSMGSISGRKALRVVENVEKILAVELLHAAQAFDFQQPLKSGKVINDMYDYIRTKIDHAETDRVFATDINTAHEIIQSGALLEISRHGQSIATPFDEQFESLY
jgi:histidine ammonia-lyase